MDNFPNGMNAVVAVISYTGYDMDDTMIINKSADERGSGYGAVYKVEKMDLSLSRRRGDPSHNTLASVVMSGRKHGKKLDDDGLPLIGVKVEEATPSWLAAKLWARRRSRLITLVSLLTLKKLSFG